MKKEKLSKNYNIFGKEIKTIFDKIWNPDEKFESFGKNLEIFRKKFGNF